MDPELARALRGLEAAAEFAKTYRFEMTPDYIALIEQVERRPENQNGADKTHVWLATQTYKRFFTLVRRVPPAP